MVKGKSVRRGDKRKGRQSEKNHEEEGERDYERSREVAITRGQGMDASRDRPIGQETKEQRSVCKANRQRPPLKCAPCGH